MIFLFTDTQHLNLLFPVTALSFDVLKPLIRDVLLYIGFNEGLSIITMVFIFFDVSVLNVLFLTALNYDDFK